MTTDRYPTEVLGEDADDGTMVENVDMLRSAVVGRRIVKAEQRTNDVKSSYGVGKATMMLTLDDGTVVSMADTYDCCARTELVGFFLDPSSVDHVIMGVGTTNGYETWHIYADWGDILRLQVEWDPGNPFYYGYGFDIQVVKADTEGKHS